MTAERQEFEAWVNNPDVLQLHETPSTESENNPYSNPWTAAAWEGWKARGSVDREDAKPNRKRKPRSEAQEPQEQASEPVQAPLESTTPVNPPEEPLEAPGEILTEISEA